MYILCVGTMFAGPLLKFAHEPPGIFSPLGDIKNCQIAGGCYRPVSLGSTKGAR